MRVEKGFVVKRALLLACLFLTVPSLCGCVPDQDDPEKSSDAGQLSGTYYASALGNVAVQVQNAVVGDPSWFSAASSERLDLGSLGIPDDTTGVPILSQMCPTGTGTAVVQLTWLDGRDADNRFWVKGIGTGAGTMVGVLRNRVSGEQVGTYEGGGHLRTAGGGDLTIPASCAGVNIPLGAPVLAFRIERPAPPVAELARTEYRTVPCGADMRGIAQRGTMVESRVVRFGTDGTITPADPEAGWSAESIGSCISDAIVEATSDTRADGGSIILDNFADVAAQGFKRLLEEQLRMDCAQTSISSDIVRKDTGGAQSRSKSQKSIDTCTKTVASPAGKQVGDTTAGEATDTRDVCVERSSTSPQKAFLGVESGTLTSALSGTAYVDRVVDNRTLSSNAAQAGERTKWVPRPAIDCTSNDTYVANCADVPGKPSGRDVSETGGKWKETAIEGEAGHAAAQSGGLLMECLFGCLTMTGGNEQALNWDYLRSKEARHGPGSTTTALGSRTAGSWADQDSFIANFAYGAFSVPAASNQCLIQKREVQLECPLAYDASKQASWQPYELSPTTDFMTTLLPGGSYAGAAGVVYQGSLERGETPGLVEVTWESCNIKGCATATEAAGPGLEAYIKSWTYTDASSVSGAASSVQTIMMNKDGQVLDYRPDIVTGPRLEYVGRYSVPLHCGRIEHRDITWPAMTFYYVCRSGSGLPVFGSSGSCRWEVWPSAATITEIVTREWSGESALVGTWSRPVVRYRSEFGTWTRVEDIPNPLVTVYPLPVYL